MAGGQGEHHAVGQCGDAIKAYHTCVEVCCRDLGNRTCCKITIAILVYQQDKISGSSTCYGSAREIELKAQRLCADIIVTELRFPFLCQTFADTAGFGKVCTHNGEGCAVASEQDVTPIHTESIGIFFI